MTQNARHASAAPLRAGAASVDITPAMGIQIDGDIGRPRPVEEIRDPLYAKALVLEAGGKKVCVLSMDLCAVNNRYADLIRDEAAKRFGFDREAVMVHPTQNHSAPSLGHFAVRDESTLIKPEHEWLRMGDSKYFSFGTEKALEVIGKANAALAPAQIGSASGLDPRVAFNRRYVMRDGTSKCNPGPDPNILHVEGPADPEVGVTAIRRGEGDIAALLLHHTCHPTHGYPTRYISADWPGTWSDGMKAAVGKGVVPLIVNGCCGNTIHFNWMDPYKVEDQKLMGQRLTETATGCLAKIQYEDRIALDYRTIKLKIPLREVDPEVLAKAKKLLADHPEPMWRKDEPDCCEWDWMYAVGRVDLAEKREKYPFYDYEIQVFRLGDTALVSLIGEPFVEAQLKMKLHSPVRHTYFAHMSNGYVGYIPTRRAFQGGGYETWTGAGSQLVHEALDTITDATIKLLHEIYEKPLEKKSHPMPEFATA